VIGTSAGLREDGNSYRGLAAVFRIVFDESIGNFGNTRIFSWMEKSGLQADGLVGIALAGSWDQGHLRTALLKREMLLGRL